MAGILSPPGVREFRKLKDTPASYEGLAGKGLRVNADEDGLEAFPIGPGGGIGGIGTINRLSKWVALDEIGDSIFEDDGSLGTVNGDLTITGDFTVNGTQTIINVTMMEVEDPLIEYGKGNVADLVDLGFYANYNDGAGRFAGIFRDATDGKFRVFDGLTVEPTTTVNIAGVGYSAADLVARILESTVPTGTAPLTISSTTLVPNLNVGLLSGVGGAGYALLAGRAGTANNLTLSTDGDGILRGSAAASQGLDLVATMHATDGPIRFFSDPTTLRATLLSTGQWIFGSATSIVEGASTTEFNQGDDTRVRIHGAVNGVLRIGNTGATIQILPNQILTTTPTFEFVVGPRQVTFGSGLGGLGFVTGSVTRAMFLDTSNTLRGNAGLTIQGGAGVHALELTGGAGQSAKIALGTTINFVGDMKMETDNDFTPSTDNEGELGTDALRWQRIRATAVVTGDLELRDDERGAHWTIREERDGIRAINRITGKSYSISLQEA